VTSTSTEALHFAGSVEHDGRVVMTPYASVQARWGWPGRESVKVSKVSSP